MRNITERINYRLKYLGDGFLMDLWELISNRSSDDVRFKVRTKVCNVYIDQVKKNMK
jgi:hypothetical protein